MKSCIYKGRSATIVGTRYGSNIGDRLNQSKWGKAYDIRLGDKVIADIHESEVSFPEEEEHIVYVAGAYGAAMPCRFKLIKG